MAPNANASHALNDARPLSPGTLVAGKYIICDVLGTGGSATVYTAEQVGLKRIVAFKIYPASGDMASQLLQRLEREAQLLARVHHKNVVAVYDAGSMPDGSPYVVVQRLNGVSLATCLLAGPLPVAEAVALTHEVLDALSALSDAGITHRDVKPDNLVFDRVPDGPTVLKLVDFGVAKEALDEASREHDAMVGTPRYMAPEQMRGEGIDARCDVYALGATLYEMLTCRAPHAGETLEDIVNSALLGAITPVRALRRDCPEGLEQVVMRALARDPSERFASAREMKLALGRWQAEEFQKAPETTRACEALEDTLVAHVPSAASMRPRGRSAKRAAFVVAGMAALGTLALSQQVDIRSHAKKASGQLAAALHASERPAFDLVLRASTLVVQTSASAADLLSNALTSARGLLEVAAPGREASGGRSVPAR